MLHDIKFNPTIMFVHETKELILRLINLYMSLLNARVSRLHHCDVKWRIARVVIALLNVSMNSHMFSLKLVRDLVVVVCLFLGATSEVLNHREISIAYPIERISYLRWDSSARMSLQRLGQSSGLSVIRTPLADHDSSNLQLTAARRDRASH